MPLMELLPTLTASPPLRACTGPSPRLAVAVAVAVVSISPSYHSRLDTSPRERNHLRPRPRPRPRRPSPARTPPPATKPPAPASPVLFLTSTPLCGPHAFARRTAAVEFVFCIDVGPPIARPDFLHRLRLRGAEPLGLHLGYST
ncbi:hypothetical protein P171DRAFT_436788 [Karstenula rhodostoma CBS 690.94]|uniref:Uncharacterized protein n=1 Tax=Karstenula rhodostoma CBS 690.94 TaxID=1392251 RepID=A0A9P4P7X7_9PLEO|nr:hypothetical protein P171DRAFT_436788 [Karstenula rhodostoma CBS 690.94]